MSPFLRVWLRRLLPLLLLGLSAGLFFVNRTYAQRAPVQNDFVARWGGGRAWIRDGSSPYDPAVSLAIQQRVYGRAANDRRGEDPFHFLYPLPVLLVFGPLGYLDYGTALAVWMSVLEVSLFGASLLWMAAARWSASGWMVAALLAFTAVWFPGFAALVEGQFAVFEVLILAGALAAIRVRREAVGGLLLVAGLAKPQLGIGLLVYTAIWAIAAGRRQLIGWMLTGLVLIGGVSLLADPQWPAGMVRQFFDYLNLPISQSAVGRLADWFGVGRTGTLLLTGLLLTYLIWEWKESIPGDERRFLWTAALTQCVVLAVVPFGTLPNLAALIFPIVVILEAWYVRHGTGTDGPAAVILFMMAIVSWLLSLDTLSGGEPSLWLILGLPLATILGLTWVRWWSYRTRSPLEIGA